MISNQTDPFPKYVVQVMHTSKVGVYRVRIHDMVPDSPRLVADAESYDVDAFAGSYGVTIIRDTGEFDGVGIMYRGHGS